MQAHARELMHNLMKIPRVFLTARQLKAWIDSDDDIYVDFYMAHAPLRQASSFVSCWWKFQAEIVISARLSKGLQIFVFFIPSIFDPSSVSSKFCSTVEADGWILHTQCVDFAVFGDSIDDYCGIILGVHRSTSATVPPLTLLTPPVRRCQPISDFVHEEFNTSSFSVSFSRPFISQYSPDDHLIATDPLPSPARRTSYFSKRKYNLLPRDDPSKHSIGAGVYDVNHLFPPLCEVSDNIFEGSFGIEYDCMNASLVRQISPYEFVRGYGHADDMIGVLALRGNFDLLAYSIPVKTSASIFDCLASRLRSIRDSSVTVDESTPFAAPAATAQILFNGASHYTLPDTERWLLEYASDPQTALLIKMVKNPSSMTRANMNKVHYVFRRYLRQSLIVLDDKGILYLREPLEGSDDFTSLQIVPQGLQNIIFIAFHANPIGGHFNAYRTMTRIRLRFFWPKMYAYITDLVHKCAGCRLANPTIKKSNELVYNFPVGTEPMTVLHLDIYKAGALRSYDNTVAYVVGACNMTSFGVMEGVSEESSAAFASALMKIQLRYGFVHTLILDKDSKFYATFRETAALLNINTHTLSRENHDPMLVERINRYFNKFLKIFTAEHSNDPRACYEGLLMSLYGWNCANVPGTDISRCLMVTGREWRFPIDFSANKHFELLSKPSTVHSYAQRQAIILSASRQIGRILIDEARSYHRELINSLRPDPLIFAVGDFVLAPRTVHSKKSLNRVGKLEFAYTGPWKILRRLHGASYECKHTASGKISKFHASHLSPVPHELVPYAPVDTSDARFGISHKPLSEDAYKLAGIEGFLPRQPFKPSFRRRVRFSDEHLPTTSDDTPPTTNLIDFQSWANATDDDVDLHYPSLAELQDEMDASVEWGDVDDMIDMRRPLSPSDTSTFASPSITPTPTLARLAAKLISSTSRLFFVSWAYPTATRREWHLVRVNLDSSISYNPDCLHNGRFLVEFFVCHPRDLHLHPRNQRWWLEYHASSELARLHEGDYHLLRPDDKADIYATQNHLRPFCQWISLIDDSTFLHGPFEFAIINGRQTRDRISTPDWTQLVLAKSKYNNAPPDIDKRDFEGVQFSRSFHTHHFDPSVRARVMATRMLVPGSNDIISA